MQVAEDTMYWKGIPWSQIGNSSRNKWSTSILMNLTQAIFQECRLSFSGLCMTSAHALNEDAFEWKCSFLRPEEVCMKHLVVLDTLLSQSHLPHLHTHTEGSPWWGLTKDPQFIKVLSVQAWTSVFELFLSSSQTLTQIQWDKKAWEFSIYIGERGFFTLAVWYHKTSAAALKQYDNKCLECQWFYLIEGF